MRFKELSEAMSKEQLFNDAIELAKIYKDVKQSFSWGKCFNLVRKTLVLVLKIVIKIVFYLGKVYIGLKAKELLKNAFDL